MLVSAGVDAGVVMVGKRDPRCLDFLPVYFYLNAQGPIIKDHLFFNAGIQYSRQEQVQPAGGPTFVQAPSAIFESIYLLGGVTFVPNVAAPPGVEQICSVLDGHEMPVSEPAPHTRSNTATYWD